ncbi:MAG: hypothetical protein KAS72_15610 [Phycisphaerales bacterium]|nr:hypothetical protein [Phycisphaerales bacterium]
MTPSGRTAIAFLITCVVLVAAVASPAAAEHPWHVPREAIGCWAFDPSGFEPAASGPAVVGVLRIAAESGLVGDEFLPLIHALIAAGHVGAAPHTLCLLNIEAQRTSPDDDLTIRKLAIVLELHTDRGHRAAMEALATILTGAPQADGGRQERLDLPGGQQGVRYRAEGWDDWRVVEWCSRPGGFAVGLGQGSLNTWFASEVEAEAPSAVTTHRRVVSDARRAEGASADGGRFIEVYLDIDALRARVPSLFTQGLTPRLLNALNLGNSRSAMLHGRWCGRLLVLDSTFDSRRGPPGTVLRRPLTLSAYPDAALELPMPEGSYVIVAQVQWTEAYRWIMGIAEGVTDDASLPAFQRKRVRYEREYNRRLMSVLGAFKPYVVISDVPPAPIAVPGATTVYFELKDDTRITSADRHLKQLLAPFTSDEQAKSLRDVHVESTGTVRSDRIWHLQLDAGGLARFPAWGWADRWLVGSWGAAGVTHNRDLLAPSDDDR